MTDAEPIREAALTVSAAFLLGFAGFSFAFATAFGGGAPYVFATALVVIAVGLLRKKGQQTPPRPASPTTDDGAWEVET